MSSPCDKVELFVDGELPDEEAEAFRQHLPDCMKCQQAMDRLMQLDFLGSSQVQQSAEQEKVAAPRSFFRPRWMVPAVGVAAALAAALVVIVMRQPGKPALQSDVWLAQRPQRLLEARVSYPDADRYRPPAAKMMGSSDSAAELSYKDLAELQQSDPHGMAAAFLVRDTQGMAKQALQELEKLGRSPDLDSDRAVAKLIEGKREEALDLLDAALAQNPRHPQALWNRALVLRELGLPMKAAHAFSEVAALKEPGWSDEAARKAEALLSAESARHERWKAVKKAGEELRVAPPASLPEGFTESSNARRLFYDAVRTAPSRERVLLLLPIAQKLDERAGGVVLQGYVRKVSEADFSRRAPLAQRYGELLQGRLSREEERQLLAALLASKEEDIFLGAHAAIESADLKAYEEKAAASGAPWFQVLAMQRRALADASAGDWKGAVQKMSEALPLCQGRGLEYRCIVLESELSNLYSSHNELERARTHAGNGWRKSRELGEWQLESILLWSLAQIARLSEDTSLTRAYLGEFATREKDDPAAARRAHQDLAVLAMQELRVEEARREIDAALATGMPLGLPGVFALADIARVKSAPGDEEKLVKAVEGVALEQKGPGGRLITNHVLGRFFIERDVERGRTLLWRVIEEAETPGLVGDDAAQRARAYSFTSLLLAAGRRNDFQEAMKLLERERRQELPRGCLLIATVDSERTLLMARGSDGKLVGHYDEQRRQPLPTERLNGMVPEALLAPLRQCEQVEVLARSPLRERPGLLPPELAWSYLTRTSTERRAPLTGSSVHLVVSDVELPADAELKRLNSWSASFGPTERAVKLSGTEATPSRVLGAMRDATEIDLVTHGVLDDRADSSYLLLAPGPGGPKLDVTQVRSASLQGAPFVVLAACHAAHATYSVDDPLSLPAAFIEAGARGVLAATVQIPDLEAQEFFNAVRERLRSGAAPALALRDERMRWLSERRGTAWLESVLLFE